MGMMGGGPTGALTGIMRGAGMMNDKGQMDPVMGGIMMELLNQQQRPRFENLMSDRELRQYETGERLPDYRRMVDGCRKRDYLMESSS
jgi:hypothetical protein